ncbi:hypothetical protein BTN98_05545 [Photobacterium aquimaris]|nr:hypothetical protein BTN98_05545 [Photobacterium aquimaris]
MFNDLVFPYLFLNRIRIKVLSGLSPELHGFHLHENASCESTKNMEKIAAGGHYDPMNTGKHGYSWTNDNHLGDLPTLYVDNHADHLYQYVDAVVNV